MGIVGTNPPRMESNCLLPVEIRTTFLRCWHSSMAVMNPDAEGCTKWLGLARLNMVVTNQALGDSIFDLLHLDLAEPFDLQEVLAGGTVDGLSN